MSFIECSDHMKDQWSKPKPKLRFKHIEPIKAMILKFNQFDLLTNKLH